MCFSPTASFISSALLATTGAAAVAHVRDRRMIPFASIPLVFALQQAIEGVLWLTIRGNGEYTMLFTQLFLFFALFWWPVYTSVALYCMESVGWRRRFLAGLGLVGLVLGVYLFAGILLDPAEAIVRNQCIYYSSSESYSTLVMVTYLLVTVGAGILSSRYWIKILFLVIGLSAFITSFMYFENFISVWCFFGAVISAWIYLIVRKSRVHKKSVHKIGKG
jgi:hypothetical protein